MALMTYDKELTTIQVWLKSVANLPSWRYNEIPAKLPRPVVILETPSRVKLRDNGRYEYVMAVNQYGRLCVANVSDVVELQDKLFTDLGERCNVLPVIEEGFIIRKLRNVELNFVGQDQDKTLEESFILSYEVTYYRTKPASAPHAAKVTNKLKTDY